MPLFLCLTAAVRSTHLCIAEGEQGSVSNLRRQRNNFPVSPSTSRSCRRRVQVPAAGIPSNADKDSSGRNVAPDRTNAERDAARPRAAASTAALVCTPGDGAGTCCSGCPLQPLTPRHRTQGHPRSQHLAHLRRRQCLQCHRDQTSARLQNVPCQYQQCRLRGRSPIRLHGFTAAGATIRRSCGARPSSIARRAPRILHIVHCASAMYDPCPCVAGTVSTQCYSSKSIAQDVLADSFLQRAVLRRLKRLGVESMHPTWKHNFVVPNPLTIFEASVCHWT